MVFANSTNKSLGLVLLFFFLKFMYLLLSLFIDLYINSLGLRNTSKMAPKFLKAEK